MTRHRSPAALAAALAALAVAGCEVKEDINIPQQVQMRMQKHQTIELQLRSFQGRYISALENYQRFRVAYQQTVAVEMTQAKAEKRAMGQVQEIAADGAKFAKELVQACVRLNEALLTRSAAARKVLSVEGQLWDLEIQAFGRRSKAAALAVVEIRHLADMKKALGVAQKEQQDAYKALWDKEREAWNTVGDDVKARDVADQQLFDLRQSLDKTFNALVDANVRYDEAADKVHRRLLAVLESKGKKSAPQVKALVEERAQLAQAMAKARVEFKDATMTKAERRSQEVAHDSEIQVVLRTAFKTDAVRDAFLVKVAPRYEAAQRSRNKMLEEESSVEAIRKQMLQLEAEVQALDY